METNEAGTPLWCWPSGGPLLEKREKGGTPVCFSADPYEQYPRQRALNGGVLAFLGKEST